MYSRFRRRGFRRHSGFRRFRRSGLACSPRKTLEPRWQVGNIKSEQNFTIDNASPTPTNLYTRIASIPLLTAQTNQTEYFIEKQYRYLDIGGISLNCGMDMVNGSGGSATIDSSAFIGQILVVDRLDNTGAPESVLWNYFSSTPPSSSFAGASNADDDAPTRILHRRHTMFSQQANLGVSIAPQATVRYTLNRRLRLRLGPTHGLYFVHCAGQGSAWGTTGTPVVMMKSWFWGTVYWRLMS